MEYVKKWAVVSLLENKRKTIENYAPGFETQFAVNVLSDLIDAVVRMRTV